VFVAEATEGAELLRVIVNTLRETGDKVTVRPTLSEGVCLSCLNSHVQPGSMRYGDPLTGEWVMNVTACHACKPKTNESQIRLERMMPDKQLKTLSAQEGGKVLTDCGIARLGYVNHPHGHGEGFTEVTRAWPKFELCAISLDRSVPVPIWEFLPSNTLCRQSEKLLIYSDRVVSS
jgi:hypothetical protein